MRQNSPFYTTVIIISNEGSGPFLLYDSLLETDILSTSVSSILSDFLIFIKIALVDLFISKGYVISSHFYTEQRKKRKIFL